MNKCIFCGEELIEGKCPNHEQHFKTMCLNCNFCSKEVSENEEIINMFCNNEEHMANALKKIKESVPSGYEIENLKIKPLPIKDVTKSCKKWLIQRDFLETINELYGKK